MIFDVVEGDASFDIIGLDNQAVEAPDPITIVQAATGNEGRSAYLSAVANGYNGTEAQWVASLKGQPGDSVIEDPGERFVLALLNAMI